MRKMRTMLRASLGALVLLVVGGAAAPQDSTWPPAATPAGKRSELTAALVMEKGVARLEYAVPKREGWHLTLLSVDFYKEDAFLGAYQRFEETTGLGKESINLPEPAGANRLLVRYQCFKVNQHEVKDGTRNGWYSSTWSHFTTAVPLPGGKWNWFRTMEPTDRNLGLWLERSQLEGERVFDEVAEVKGI